MGRLAWLGSGLGLRLGITQCDHLFGGWERYRAVPEYHPSRSPVWRMAADPSCGSMRISAKHAAGIATATLNWA